MIFGIGKSVRMNICVSGSLIQTARAASYKEFIQLDI